MTQVVEQKGYGFAGAWEFDLPFGTELSEGHGDGGCQDGSRFSILRMTGVEWGGLEDLLVSGSEY